MEKSDIPSFKVQFGDYGREDGVIYYKIRVLSIHDNSFHINDRYSNMRRLWDEVRKSSKSPDKIPEFPPKKWFGSKNRDFVEQRKSALENFFNTLLDSPDKNVYIHIIRYFKSLARNREAKDAIQSIEESVTNKSQTKSDISRTEEPNMSRPLQSYRANPPTAPIRRTSPPTIDKENSESCSKIVENFNKNLIDIEFGRDGGDIQINKGQTYKKHFEETGINKTFKYETKLLDIPAGSDENFKLLEEDEEIEQQNDAANEKLERMVDHIYRKVYQDPYSEYVEATDVVFHCS